MPITLEKLIHRHATYRSDEIAAVFGEQRLSWQEFEKRVNQVSNALICHGIKKNDKVATALENSMELLTIYWATVSIGAVLVPLSPLLKGQGLVNLLNNSNTKLLFLNEHILEELNLCCDKPKEIIKDGYIVLNMSPKTKGVLSYISFLEHSLLTAPPFPEMEQNDLFNIVYSSGTTGEPKGITHSHLVRSHYGTQFAASFRITPESVVLQTGSIVFNGAFVTLMPCFFVGATYILHSHFDVEAMIDTISEESVTHIMMVPAQITAMLKSPNFTIEKLQSLQMVLTLGAPLQQHFKEQFNQVIPNRFYELYGLTEGFVTILDKTDFNQQSGSVGCPPPGYDIRIVDDNGHNLEPNQVGEIVGRGPILSEGYYNQPKLTLETIRDGWLYTGDMGYLDDRGFLYLSGRKKELIISGGINVYPRDIEEIASQHPEILEVAVFGVESEKWGETPVAAIELKQDLSIEPAVLKRWINDRIEARFQKVSEVFIIEKMPRNIAGKTVKNVLKQMYDDDHQ